MKRPLIALVPLFALLLASAAPVRAATPDPVRIDVILEMSGVAAFLGQGESQALQILQGVVNARGGINGRPVEFVIGDDQSNPAQAVQIMQAIVSRKASAIIGTGFTATCNAIMPLSKTNGPVTYCITPGVHPPAGSYAFSANVGTESMAPVMLRYFKERGWTRFAFISSTDASGQDMENGVNAAMRRPEFAGMTMVDREHFNTADLSVAAQMSRIKAAQPQAAIFWTAGTGFGTLLRSAHDNALDMPIMGGNANENYAQLKQYKDFIPAQLYFPSPRAIAEGGALPGPIHDAQAVYFKAYHDAGARPDLPATMAWDPAMILIDAYRHLGVDASADKVRDYIENLHGWIGVNGVYDFSGGSQRGLGENACLILRYDGPTDTFITSSRPMGLLK
jgi:branched-chain amino acid transport system substrate-binding protein